MSGVDGLKAAARRIIDAALRAADPRAAVAAAVSVSASGLDQRLQLQAQVQLQVCGRRRALEGKLHIVAVGKAAAAMSAAAAAALHDVAGRVATVVVVIPRGYPFDRAAADFAGLPPVEVHASGHPVPDEAGVAAARRVREVLDGMDGRDLCILLLSGGGSSLLPLPAPGVSLADKQAVTSLLLACGADIAEINTVRKHLSAIKGGRLAARCRGSIETLAISDVVGDPLPSIASGPTVADPTTFADAWSILERFGLADRLPAGARRALREGIAGTREETPKVLPERHRATVIASNRLAVDAASRAAAAAGYPPLVLTTYLGGEAREVGRTLAAIAREVRASGRPVAAPACLLAGGETTVTLRGRAPGRGGRNQELALAAALALEGIDGVLAASFATDGKEGNTDAAGAFASGETVRAGRRGGLDPRACLAANDSGAFLSAAGELIVTGPTGTNVNDLAIVLVAP